MKFLNSHNKLHIIVLTLIIISNICFYTEETMKLYLVLTMFAMVLEFAKVALSVNICRVRMIPCLIWLVVIYAIFTYNGLYRLKFGDYNWDFMIYTCVQNMALFFAFRFIFICDTWYEDLKPTIFISAWVSLVITLFNEFENIREGSIRIGDSLSGNVVTVGAYFGILSVFMAFICSKEKKMFYWISFIVTIAAMFLTGSKVVVVIVAIDLLFFLNAAKHKGKALLIASILGLIAIFVIFNVPYFYQIIGFRIEDMFFQMFGIGHGHYSNSTKSREILIQEGLRFMWDYPIFGGGEKYFGSKTSTVYSYSHCNYIELLVNFGITGFCLYYLPLFKNFKSMLKTRRHVGECSKLCIALMATRFVVDWMMMTHSEPCIGYIPMILSFVYVDINRKRSQYQLEASYVQAKNITISVE